MNRRSFFQALVGFAGVLAVYNTVAQAERKRGGGAAAAGATLVDPKDAAAKAVNYVEKTSDIKDKALMTERSGVKFADQKCLNCAFYQADKETTVGGKKAGPCQMPFAAGKVVTQSGWCTSWAKKA